MYDFINSLRLKSRHAESVFVCMLDTENVTYTNKLLTCVYDLKKSTCKLSAYEEFVKTRPDLKNGSLTVGVNIFDLIGRN